MIIGFICIRVSNKYDYEKDIREAKAKAAKDL